MTLLSTWNAKTTSVMNEHDVLRSLLDATSLPALSKGEVIQCRKVDESECIALIQKGSRYCLVHVDLSPQRPPEQSPFLELEHLDHPSFHAALVGFEGMLMRLKHGFICALKMKIKYMSVHFSKVHLVRMEKDQPRFTKLISAPPIGNMKLPAMISLIQQLSLENPTT